MSEQVQIKITGYQKGADLPNPEEITTEATGVFKKMSDCKLVVYREESEEGEGNQNIFKYSPRRVEHVRKGTTQTTMVFVPGEKTRTGYNTPYGLFDIEIETTALSVSETLMSTEVVVAYNMTLNGGSAIECRTVVKIDF